MKNRFTILMSFLCCAFAVLPSTAFGATGDIQNATIRIRNVTATGSVLGSVPSFVEDSYQSWAMNVAGVTATLQVPQAKQATYRIRMNSTANGQIQPVFTDKYGLPWNNIYTVRHGSPTMTYDLNRPFSSIRFVDQNNNPFAFDSLHLTTSPSASATVNNMLFGSITGYYFPVVLPNSGYYFIGVSGNINVPISLDQIGADFFLGDGVLPLTVSGGKSGTGKSSIQIGKLIKTGVKKLEAPNVADEFEIGLEVRAKK